MTKARSGRGLALHARCQLVKVAVIVFDSRARRVRGGIGGLQPWRKERGLRGRLQRNLISCCLLAFAAAETRVGSCAARGDVVPRRRRVGALHHTVPRRPRRSAHVLAALAHRRLRVSPTAAVVPIARGHRRDRVGVRRACTAPCKHDMRDDEGDDDACREQAQPKPKPQLGMLVCRRTLTVLGRGRGCVCGPGRRAPVRDARQPRAAAGASLLPPGAEALFGGLKYWP